MSAPDLETLVRAIIAAGESFYAEFKSAWTFREGQRIPRNVSDVATDVEEAMVAFANADGGDLLVGVEDDGTVTGLPWVGDSEARFLKSLPSTRQAALGARVFDVSVDGRQVLLFRVEEYPDAAVTTSAGKCLWRKKSSTVPVPPAEIDRRRKHHLGDTRFEGEPVPEATVADVEIPWGQLERRSHLASYAAKADPVPLLRYWNLLEARNGEVVLRRAALLLFASDPLRWHPNNRLRVRRNMGLVEGYGREMRSRETDVGGPIVRMLASSVAALRRGLEVERRESNLFGTSQLLPSDAVEECLVNAAVHRNYAILGNAIEVLIFPDRVEFRSPGKLPEPLTVSDLRAQRGAHRTRNPLIMRVLRDLGWARDQGEGMRRIFGAMSQVELDEPDLEEQADTFIVRLSTKPRYDESTQAWLAAYGPFGLEPEERKCVVVLRSHGNALSADRLARRLGESYDATKQRLDKLERRGIVWHGPKSRTYHLVEPLQVPLERALKLLRAQRIKVGPDVIVGSADLRRLGASDDEKSLASLEDRLRNGGVLVPAGKGAWRFAPSMLEYLRAR